MNQSITYKVVCTKATCRYTETYQKNPGHPRCPKYGSIMIPKRVTGE